MRASHPSDGPAQPVVVPPGSGRRLQVGPFAMLVVEDGSHTSGSHAVLECILDGQFSPPPHIHRQHEEVMYVLNGELALSAGGHTLRLAPGAAFVTPVGLPHTFSNGGAGRLRFLLTISPASHLGYFEALAQAAQATQGAPDPQTMMQVMQRWGLEPVRPAS